MAKTCPRCNTKNRNNARFCNECSARFPVESPLPGPGGHLTIFDAMRKNDLKAVRAFIKGEAHVNSADDDGYTPLHWAAENGYLPFAKLLLSKGADPGAATRDGWTPLDLARTEGHTQMELLLEESPALMEKKKKAKPLKKKG